MGVSKILMASNDTLFNFEDTLGDRDDMMLSPRNVINSSNYIAMSTTPQPDNCKTPTNETYLHLYPIEYKPNETIANNDTQLTNEMRPNTLQLNLENLNSSFVDLLSPEQQKTISEEINTIEQLSSDLSATIDATNTLDDLKTCISIYLNDDAITSNVENFENDVITNDANKLKSTESIGSVEKEQQSTHSHQGNMLEKCQIDEQNMKRNKTMTTDPNVDFLANEKSEANKSPNYDIPSTKPEAICASNKTLELTQLSGIHNCQSQPEHSNGDSYESVGQLSGEEDPWV